MPKKQILKPRGVRFSDAQWDRLNKEAKRHKATPSDVVRAAVDGYFKEQDHKQIGL